MQLARLRIPRPRVSFEWLGALGGRTTILYVGYTAVLFLIFLLATFPHDLLIRRALSTMNQGAVTVEFNTAGFAWINGYELTGMRILSRNADVPVPYLECSHLWVRPAFSEWLRGNPYGMVVSADLYGGAAQGDVNLKDGNLVGAVAWHDLNLGRYRTLTALLDEGQLNGLVSGQMSFEARGPTFAAGQGTGELNLDGASIVAAKVNGFTVPDVKLKQTKIKFKVGSGRLEIQELNASGDVSVQGSGQIILRDPLTESTLNLRATFLPSPTSPDAIKGALALIPHPTGAKPDAPVTITGSLTRPKFR